MISAAYSGVSFFDIGSFKKINFPGYPQRFTPVLILSFLIGLKMIKTNIYSSEFFWGTFFPKKLCLDSNLASWDLKIRIPRRKLHI